jgi:tRNA threonylcarbamoyladenosine biosynthesis protein TsaB
MILTIRTDKQEAEIGLFSDDGQEVAYKKWQAHRKLSSTILVVIKEILNKQSLSFTDLSGVVFYKGPGSFTGLRIGASVVNALQAKCVNENGEGWIKNGIKRLNDGENEPALPHYGEEAHTTKPKK